MLRTVIVEDELLSLNMMKRYVGEHPKYELVGAYSDPLEALQDIPGLEADVLFIDIGMPGINGLQLAEQVKNEFMQIVFTTAYREYALEAFRVEAVDYLLKPITRKAIDSVASKLEKIKKLLAIQSIESRASVMKVQCFGSFQTTNKAGEIVKWPTKKTEEMFAYFIVKEGQIVNKWIIADMLWPEMDSSRAIHNVYNTIYRMKKTFEKYSLPLSIRVINEGYVLEVEGEAEIDFHIIRGLSAQRDLTADQLQLMHDLYAGPLFNDKDYAWSIHLKESFDVLFLNGWDP
ncbi:response regulator [Paenibacillus ihumii]|uniref:response regulator n=1 Tax=Paenibacillus ihumii TaxID=687436 RepID=UPI0006D81313|nr:response regulator [Paenibacillus ihumii]